MEKITIHGKEYHTRTAKLLTGDEVLIGEISIEHHLFNGRMEPKYEDSDDIDIMFFCYCKLHHILNDTDEQFNAYIDKLLKA